MILRRFKILGKPHLAHWTYTMKSLKYSEGFTDEELVEVAELRKGECTTIDCGCENYLTLYRYQ